MTMSCPLAVILVCVLSLPSFSLSEQNNETPAVVTRAYELGMCCACLVSSLYVHVDIDGIKLCITNAYVCMCVDEEIAQDRLSALQSMI
jgi:hypothetical protein